MKPRVLHCIHSLAGGGAERQLSLLCQHGSEAYLENVTFYIDDANYTQQTNRTLVKYNRTSKIDIGIFRAMAGAIDKVKPDVLHAWLPPVITIPTLLIGWQKKIPVIVSYRNSKKISNFWGLLEYVFTWMFASGIASNTNIEFCSFPYRLLYRSKKSILIKNAVSVPLTADRNFMKSGKLAILLAGRITSQKNWKCLLEALALVRDEISWSLSICGKGEDEKQLEEYIIGKKLESRVKMLGYRRDLYRIMEDSDLLVHPSWYEGMPNVPLESFAIGLPCILSDIPEHKDLVGLSESEIYFPPDKPEVLAEKLIFLYRNTLRLKEMASRGKKIVANYTVEKMISRYAGFYQTYL